MNETIKLDQDAFTRDLVKLIQEHNLESGLGVPTHILANVMINAIALFTDSLSDMNDYYDEVNEQLRQEQMEGD